MNFKKKIEKMVFILPPSPLVIGLAIQANHSFLLFSFKLLIASFSAKEIP
jgi:hypothetical protein